MKYVANAHVLEKTVKTFEGRSYVQVVAFIEGRTYKFSTPIDTADKFEPSKDVEVEFEVYPDKTFKPQIRVS